METAPEDPGERWVRVGIMRGEKQPEASGPGLWKTNENKLTTSGTGSGEYSSNSDIQSLPSELRGLMRLES